MSKKLIIILSKERICVKVAQEGNITTLCDFKSSDQSADSLREHLMGDGFDVESISSVQIFLDTDQVALVPEAAFEQKMAAAYHQVGGGVLRSGQTVVCSPTVNGIVAVMSWDSKVVELLAEFFGDKKSYYSPIQLEDMHNTQNSLNLFVSEDRVYITVVDKVLMYAEVLHFHTTEDIVYIVEPIKLQYEIGHRQINIAGENISQLVDLVKKHNKHVSECIINISI